MHSQQLRAMIAAARSGGEEAYRQLLAGYGPRLYGYFYRATRSHHDAEDLLGEVMLRLDPGDIPTDRAQSPLRVFQGGGETNVACGLAYTFGLRTAVLTALVFPEINGVETLPDPVGFEEATLAVAASERSMEELTDWMKAHVGDD